MTVMSRLGGGVRRSVWSLGAALVVSAGALTGTAQATPVGPVDLGTLPGDEDSSVFAVNDAGVMVGLSKGATTRPVRWDADGQITALPTPGGAEGEVRDINAGGVSAGVVLTATDAVPTRWDAQGQATTLQLPPGYHNATAWAISDTDVVVGNWTTPDGEYHAFRWDPDGQATDLGTLPGETWSMVEDITADGSVIVGSGYRDGANQAVRWVDGGPITELAPQGRSSGMVDVNDGGVSAGTMTEPIGGVRSPVVWERDGTMCPLEWPSPHTVWTTQIGSTGYVVGFGYLNAPDRSLVRWAPDGTLTVLPDDGRGTVEAVDAQGTAAGRFQNRATLWYVDGQRVQLGTLPGGNRSGATGITDTGRVIGSATTADGDSHAVYWDLS